MTQPLALAELLDKYRDTRGIAEAVGCSKHAVGWWLRGYIPQPRYRRAIAAALGTEPERIQWGVGQWAIFQTDAKATPTSGNTATAASTKTGRTGTVDAPCGSRT